MSTEENTRYLESQAESFAAAKFERDVEKMHGIIRLLRDDGFESEADTLQTELDEYLRDNPPTP